MLHIVNFVIEINLHYFTTQKYISFSPHFVCYFYGHENQILYDIDLVARIIHCTKNMAQLSEDEIAKIKRSFLELDEDGSGEISVHELQSILKDPKLRMSEDDVNKLMKDFDLDGNGTIDICEFLILMSNRKNRNLIHRAIVIRTQIRKMFRNLDLDGNGYITKKEFKTVMRKQRGKYSEKQLDAMLKEADMNGDGKIDYDEFVVSMTK